MLSKQLEIFIVDTQHIISNIKFDKEELNCFISFENSNKVVKVQVKEHGIQKILEHRQKEIDEKIKSGNRRMSLADY